MIRGLFKRSGIYFLGLMGGRVLSVIVFILFARALLPDKFGDLVLYMTLSQIITFVGDFGLVQWYQKRFHSEEGHTLFTKLLNARLITLFLSVILSGIFFAFVPTFPIDIILLFLIALTPSALLSVVDGFYFAKNQSLKVSLKTISRMAFFLAGFLLFMEDMSLTRAIQIYIVGDILTLLWFFPWMMIGRFKVISLRLVFLILKSSFPYAFFVLTSFAYARGDSVVIRYLLGSTALGLYGAAYRFLEGLSLLPTALSHNLFPLSSKEKKVSFIQAKKMSIFMSAIGLIISLFLFFNATLLILTLLGPSYVGAVPILKVFSLVVLLFFISAPINTIILSSHLVKHFLPYGAANTLLNIVLNIIFVPLYGIIAAAWVMFITELTGLLLNIWFVKKVYES